MAHQLFLPLCSRSSYALQVADQRFQLARDAFEQRMVQQKNDFQLRLQEEKEAHGKAMMLLQQRLASVFLYLGGVGFTNEKQLTLSFSKCFTSNFQTMHLRTESEKRENLKQHMEQLLGQFLGKSLKPALWDFGLQINSLE